MFRFDVNIEMDVDDDLCKVVENTISKICIDDVTLSCTKDTKKHDRYDYKHIGIMITDDESIISDAASEFLFVIMVGDKIPSDITQISGLISSGGDITYFGVQLTQVITSVIYTYMYRITKAMLDTTINSTPDLVWYKALDGVHFNVNDAFCYTVSKDKKDVEDNKHAYIWNVSENEAFACQESEEITLKEGKTCSFEEMVNTPDGIKTMVTYKTPLYTIDGTLIGTAGIANDVTKQREYEAKLHELAMTDALSGLYNRRKLYDEAANKYPDEKTVVYLDIDYFKDINDTYGHEMGDLIIKLVSEQIKAKFEDGISARMGGDEFVVVLDGGYTEENVREKIDKMYEVFETSDDIENVNIYLSVGVYKGDAPIEEAIRCSDEQMYIDKKKHHETMSK